MEDVYVFPMSFAQQRLWMIDQIFPGNLAYNIVFLRRVKGVIDQDAMQASVDFLIQRHESLRTTFSRHKGESVQVIHQDMPVKLAVYDLRAMTDDAAEDEAQRILREVSRTSFDLLKGPLFRMKLIQMDDDDAYWVIEMHHIISDGRSMAVFFDEFRLCYAAFRRGQTPELDPLPVQYADYTVWQRKWLADGVREKQMAFWSEHLASRPPRLNLPTRGGLQISQNDAGDMFDRIWDKGKIDAFRPIGRSRNATLFMTMMSAFLVLLYRYTGQTDISLGIPIANRNHLEIERLIGFFVNTLVLRIDLSGNPTFYSLLDQVRAATLQAYQNQDLPFEELVKAFETDRDSLRNPLVQILFNFITDSFDPKQIDNLEITRKTPRNYTAIFDLTVTIYSEEDAPRINFRYNTELFDNETIDQIADHYEILLDEIAADPDRPISEYRMISEAECERIVHDWNRPPDPLPDGETLQSLFARQVSSRPDAVAVTEKARGLTYRQLDEQATQLAAQLHAAGVQGGDMVGLHLQRRMEWVIAVLAVLKAGAIYVPLAILDPAVRTQQILADSGAKLVITQPDQEARLGAWDGARLVIDEGWFEQADMPDGFVTAESQADDPVYLMYTSGSTGKPKGVLIPQRGVMRLVLDQNYMTLGPESVIAHASNIAFDAATFEIWGALLNGGRLAILDQDTLLSAEKLRQAIEAQQITGMFITTALFNQIVGINPNLFKGMDTVIFGGEAGDPRAVRRVLEADHPPARLINAYGPTETTTFALWYDARQLPADAQTLPIGHPIRRGSAYVVDANLNLLPPGVIGELVIGGPGVGLGYHNRPGLTADRFVPDPFSEIEGAMLYRTGDRARFTPDGVIEFEGRVDDQVKLHGFRIEPGEIEYLLKQAPKVQDALVMVVTDEHGEKSIVGYAIADGASEGDLHAFLADRLPPYMIPRHIMILKSFPLTANGKIDRQALPAPKLSMQRGTFTPTNETEAQLAAIWREVLDLEEVGIHDDFFALGGHSLLAINLLSAIERTFKQEVALSLLFESPTIAMQAQVLRARRAEETLSLVPMRPNGDRRPLYMIHPGGGLLFTYTDLVSHLPKALPVFGLQAQGLRGEAEPHSSINEMAAHYIQAIRQHQTEGPYQLCGFSGGGIIAYEMAVQLKAAGEETSALILLDAIMTKHPYSEPIRPSKNGKGLSERIAGLGGQLRASLAADVEAMRSQPAGKKLAFAARRMAHHWEWQVMRRINRTDEVPDPAEHPDWEPEKKVLWAIRHAIDSYEPTAYDGKVTYIQARDNQRPNAYRVWDELAAELELITLEGNHLEIVKGERAAELAERISDLLEG